MHCQTLVGCEIDVFVMHWKTWAQFSFICSSQGKKVSYLFEGEKKFNVVYIQMIKNLRTTSCNSAYIQTWYKSPAACWTSLQCSCMRNNLMFHLSCSSKGTPWDPNLGFHIPFTLIKSFLRSQNEERDWVEPCVSLWAGILYGPRGGGACFRVLTFILHTIIYITKTNPCKWKIWQ